MGGVVSRTSQLIKESFAILKKSGHLFRKAWGENFIGGVGMGLPFVGLGAIGIIPIVITRASFAVIAAVVVYWFILGIIYSSLKGIFVATLYDYANNGEIPSIYSPEVIKNAFIKSRIYLGVGR